MRLALIGMLAVLPWMWLQEHKPPWRDWAWTKGVMVLGFGASAWLLTIEPFLAFAGFSVMVRWKPDEHWPLLYWAGAVALWFLVQRADPSIWPWVLASWFVLVALNTWLSIGQYLALRGWLSDNPSLWSAETVNRYAGTFGQRTLGAAFLTLMFPLAFLLPSPWSWVAAGVILVAQAFPCSWLAGIATLGATVVLWPGLALWVLAVLLAAAALIVYEYQAKLWFYSHGRMTYALIDRFTSRGDSLDSVFMRWRHWTGAWAIWRQWPVWVTGRGLGMGWGDALRSQLGRSTKPAQSGHMHNEWIEFVYEHGLLGVVAVFFLAYRVVPALHLGDPWSACVVAGALLAAGTYSVRVLPLGALWWIAMAWVTR